LYVELQAYQYHVFYGFRQVADSEWRAYSQLASALSGRGVPDIEEAIKEQVLQPLHDPFRELANAAIFRWITAQRVRREKPDGTLYLTVMNDLDPKIRRWLAVVRQLSKGSQDDSQVADEMLKKLSVLLRLPVLDQAWGVDDPTAKNITGYLGFDTEDSGFGYQLALGDPRIWGTLLSWLFTHSMGKCLEEGHVAASETSRYWLDEWLLAKILKLTLVDLGLDGYTAGNRLDLVRVLVAHAHWWTRCQPSRSKRKAKLDPATPLSLLRTWLNDESVQAFIGMNRYNEVVWFNKEAFEELLWWLFLISLIEISAQGQKKPSLDPTLVNCFTIIQALLEAEAGSDYQVEKLLTNLA
jgi:hypothetical protein